MEIKNLIEEYKEACKTKPLEEVYKEYLSKEGKFFKEAEVKSFSNDLIFEILQEVANFIDIHNSKNVNELKVYINQFINNLGTKLNYNKNIRDYFQFIVAGDMQYLEKAFNYLFSLSSKVAPVQIIKTLENKIEENKSFKQVAKIFNIYKRCLINVKKDKTLSLFSNLKDIPDSLINIFRKAFNSNSECLNYLNETSDDSGLMTINLDGDLIKAWDKQNPPVSSFASAFLPFKQTRERYFISIIKCYRKICSLFN